MEWYDAARDLFLGERCLGCERPGRALCPPCRATLPTSAYVAWPRPSPPGLALPVATGAYAGLLKALVNAHKERAAYALAAPLGELLATAVQAVPTLTSPGADLVCLVPVPARRATVRSRGHDPLLRVSRRAAVRLRADGHTAVVSALLSPVGRVRDQAGLSSAERAENLAETMRARRGARPADPPVVVVDDVLTTGATAREAQRALECAGFRVAGIAAIAATRRWAADDSIDRLPLDRGGG